MTTIMLMHILKIIVKIDIFQFINYNTEDESKQTTIAVYYAILRKVIKATQQKNGFYFECSKV